MIKFKGKIAAWWVPVLVIFNVFTIMMLVMNNFAGYSSLFIPSLMMVNIYMLPVLFKNYVTIDRNRVTLCFGLITKTIPTQDILTVEFCKKSNITLCASSDRIKIEIKGMDPVMISVEDKEGFVEVLAKRNPRVKRAI